MIEKIFHKLLNRETVMYLIFGVLSTIVDWAVYILMKKAGTDFQTATIVSQISAILFAFIVNKLFVFQSWDLRFKTVTKEFFTFTVCRIGTSVFNFVAMLIMVSGLKMNDYISKLIISVAIIVLNYVFSKLLIFKKREA